MSTLTLPGLPTSPINCEILFEAAPDAMVIVDRDGRILLANRQTQVLFGYAEGELLGKAVEVLLPERLHGAHQHLRSSFVQAPKARPMGSGLDLFGRRKNGSEFPVEISLSPAISNGNDLVIAAIRDVSEKRKLEFALSHLLVRTGKGMANVSFGELLNATPDALVIVGRDGRIVLLNRQAEALFGYATNELIGEAIEVLVPERLRDGHLQFRFSYGQAPNGRPMGSGLDLFARRKDGSEFPVEISLSPAGPQSAGLVIAAIRDVTEKKVLEHALTHQALHDNLTGLPNRTLLLDRIEQGIAVARRNRTTLALLFMDLDRFKPVNDSFGHRSGDLLLRQIGPRLREVLRASDTIARHGGDEFAVVLPGMEEATAISVTGKLLAQLEKVFVVEGHALQIGASIGVAFYPAHGQDAETLMDHADQAMYRAKSNGGGYAIFTQ